MPNGSPPACSNVDPKSVRWERRRIDVKRDGEKYVTLYSTEDLPERVIEVSSSLPGALGSAYQRVDEMLSGYTSIPANGTSPARNGRRSPPATSTRAENVAADGVRAATKVRDVLKDSRIAKTGRVALAAALLVLTAAASPPSRHPWTQPGHLRLGVLRTIDNLNPLLSGQAGVTDLAQFLFSGLIRYDERGDSIPDAATAVPTRENGGISADGTTITYHLRAGIRFSDGTPLTADDVVFTFTQIMNPRNNVPYHFPYDQARSVTAPDPRTVVVRLRAPSAPFVTNFFRCGVQGAILPKHLLAGKPDLNQNPFKPASGRERTIPGDELRRPTARSRWSPIRFGTAENRDSSGSRTGSFRAKYAAGRATHARTRLLLRRSRTAVS